MNDAGSFPSSIYLETSVRCNTRCPMCPSQYLERPDMELDTALNVIEQCVGKSVRELHPFQYADPFVWPHLTELLEASTWLLPNTDIILYTNGALLTDEMCDVVLRTNVRYMCFSVDGVTSHVYEMHRPGLNLDAVTKNINHFLSRNKDAGRPVHTRIHFTITPDNEHQRVAFVRQWIGKVREVTYLNCDSRNERMLDAADAEGYRRFGPNTGSSKPCAQPFNGLFILCDGNVGMCCVDYEPNVSLGNINESSIEDIWNGEPLRHVRRLHNAGRKFQIPICATCSTVR